MLGIVTSVIRPTDPDLDILNLMERTPMRATRGATVALVALAAAGCSLFRENTDVRPYPLPAPGDVQQETRDARYFLAYPLEDFLPGHAFRPGLGSKATTSY